MDPGQAGIPTLTVDSYPTLIQEIGGQQRSRVGKKEEAILALSAVRDAMAQVIAEILQRSTEILMNYCGVQSLLLINLQQFIMVFGVNLGEWCKWVTRM